MKIAGLQKLSLSDYPGIPAAVVFLQGCNLNCPFCHNRELIPLSTETNGVSRDKVVDYMFSRKKNLKGIVVTGGEPALHQDLEELLNTLKSMGLRVKLDTNGTYPERLKNIVKNGLTDYVAMDVKAPWRKYDKLTGVAVKCEKINESMAFLAGCGVAHHFRTTFAKHLLTEGDIEDIKSTIPIGSRHVVQQYICSTELSR